MPKENKYCEWKGKWIDKNKWKYTTDCGQEVIVTRGNKYDKVLKTNGSKCPFCQKEHNVYCYD